MVRRAGSDALSMSLRSTAPARAVSCGRRRVDHLGAPEVRRSGSDGVCVRVVDVRYNLNRAATLMEISSERDIPYGKTSTI